MAAEANVAYPCQENGIPNWYYVHNMYRTHLIMHWCSRKAQHMAQSGEENYGNTWDMLRTWRGQLDADLSMLDMKNELVVEEMMMIRKVQLQLESNWGVSDLSEKHRSDPRLLMEQVQRALQEVVNAAEFIYPTLKKEDYSRGRQKCAEIQELRYPNQHYIDLVLLTPDRKGTIPPVADSSSGK
jgi:hypothetical protein